MWLIQTSLYDRTCHQWALCYFHQCELIFPQSWIWSVIILYIWSLQHSQWRIYPELNPKGRSNHTDASRSFWVGSSLNYLSTAKHETSSQSSARFSLCVLNWEQNLVEAEEYLYRSPEQKVGLEECKTHCHKYCRHACCMTWYISGYSLCVPCWPALPGFNQPTTLSNHRWCTASCH